MQIHLLLKTILVFLILCAADPNFGSKIQAASAILPSPAKDQAPAQAASNPKEGTPAMAYQIRRETVRDKEILHLEGPNGIPRLSMIPAAGAYVYSWIVADSADGPSSKGVEMLYPGDNMREALGLKSAGILAGFPFLFPFANRVFQDGKEGAYTWEGKQYPMTIHGFSNNVPWTVVSAEGGNNRATVVIALEDSDKTREMYPWKFRVELTYTLEAERFTVDHKIANKSDSPMPLAPGWHPYFKVPVTSEGTKAACILRVPGKKGLGINVQNCMMDGTDYVFTQRQMTAAEHGLIGKYITDLTEPKTSIFDPAARIGAEMDLRGPDGKLAWPYILTWTLSDDAPFFCIEPYEGVTDAVHNKIGLRILQPGLSYETRLRTEVIRK